MKLEATTEQEMRQSVAPTPATIEELNEYIQSCLDAIKWPKKEDGALEHATDESGAAYGRCVYAMSLASTATFNFMASTVGASGFQASCADLDILRRTRHMEGPFTIVNIADMLFPQYDVVGRLQTYIASADVQEWLKEQAQKKLNELKSDGIVAPAVVEHWKKLAA